MYSNIFRFFFLEWYIQVTHSYKINRLITTIYTNHSTCHYQLVNYSIQSDNGPGGMLFTALSTKKHSKYFIRFIINWRFLCEQLFCFIETFYCIIFLYRPGTSVKLRLLIQRELGTLRALEKHGLQPALIIHWAQSLVNTVSLNWCIFLKMSIQLLLYRYTEYLM